LHCGVEAAFDFFSDGCFVGFVEDVFVEAAEQADAVADSLFGVGEVDVAGGA
jgi:hypothetical protein